MHKCELQIVEMIKHNAILTINVDENKLTREYKCVELRSLKKVYTKDKCQKIVFFLVHFRSMGPPHWSGKWGILGEVWLQRAN